MSSIDVGKCARRARRGVRRRCHAVAAGGGWVGKGQRKQTHREGGTGGCGMGLWCMRKLGIRWQAGNGSHTH